MVVQLVEQGTLLPKSAIVPGDCMVVHTDVTNYIVVLETVKYITCMCSHSEGKSI